MREDRDGALHVVVSTPDARPWDAAALAGELDGSAVSVWWSPARGRPRLVAGSPGAGPGLAFVQVHAAFGERIRADAVGGLGDLDGRTVWDLYGGVGETARALAARGAAVWSVEADRGAVEWARANPETGAVCWVADRVEHVLGDLPEPDVVIANPPRAGMDRTVTEALDRWAAGRPGGRLGYVSCDPATLARDLKRMPSLELRSVVAYDLFPQTSHVETLTVLEAKCDTR
jgi:tRNA/tmRNA/rRNA uracil-C5-methylase (TrmA/RlmC/RlmD family)